MGHNRTSTQLHKVTTVFGARRDSMEEQKMRCVYAIAVLNIVLLSVLSPIAASPPQTRLQKERERLRELRSRSQHKEINEIRGNIKQKTAQLRQLSLNLIAIAQNEQQPKSMRRDAIFALGSNLDARALEFLLKNIDMKIVPEPAFFLGDGDELKLRPCFYVLRESNDWRVARAILKTPLDHVQSDKRLTDYTAILKRILGTYQALALVKNGMEDWAHPGLRDPKRAKTRHTNLKKMYAILYRKLHGRQPAPQRKRPTDSRSRRKR